MSHPGIKKLIEGIATEEKVYIRGAFEKVVAEKAYDYLATKKIDIAKRYFNESIKMTDEVIEEGKVVGGDPEKMKEKGFDPDAVKKKWDENYKDHDKKEALEHRKAFTDADAKAHDHHLKSLSSVTDAGFKQHNDKFDKHYKEAREHLFAYHRLTGKRLKGKLLYARKNPLEKKK